MNNIILNYIQYDKRKIKKYIFSFDIYNDKTKLLYNIIKKVLF